MKICVATGTRAEYGLLKPLIDKIKENSSYTLQILITGAHLSPEFGLTVTQVLADGYDTVEKVEMLLSSDTATGIVKSMGLGMIGYADALQRLKPDLLVILGDRYEMLAVASSALIFKIPIAHLHGGEITEGAYDDSIRHAITKMSSIHFASTEEHKNRIIQLGENPNVVYNVGAIGLDNIHSLNLLTKQEIETAFDFKFQRYNFLITFHPETLSNHSASDQFRELLTALDQQKESLLIFTKANADTDGRVINTMIGQYVQENPDKAVAFSSMGIINYLSTMNHCTAVVGNSSSGIIEAPSFSKPTINIGNRQKGRMQATSVLNVNVNEPAILAALEKVKQRKNEDITNPYGTGNTAIKILAALAKINVNSLLPKPFFNLKIDV